jgi:hypothetical protein
MSKTPNDNEPKTDTENTPTTAALGRAILNLESEAGKMHIEASLARSNGDEEHARFFLSRASQAREDAKLLLELMNSSHNNIIQPNAAFDHNPPKP